VEAKVGLLWREMTIGDDAVAVAVAVLSREWHSTKVVLPRPYKFAAISGIFFVVPCFLSCSLPFTGREDNI
jgi:hypothetical protein